MAKKVFFIGDSNVLFFNKCLGDWDSIFNPEYWRMTEDGDSTINYDDFELTFLWKSGLTTVRVNETYLNNIFKNANVSITPDDTSAMVFIFGRLDLQNRVSDIFDIESILIPYIKRCLSFAQKHNSSAYFATAIIHKKYATESLINYFNDSLASLCESIDGANLIDFTKIVPLDHDSDPRDLHTHLTLEDSRHAFEYMMNAIKLGGKIEDNMLLT